MGVLADWVGGLGKGIVNMLGSGVAGVRDLGAMIAGNYKGGNDSETAKWQMFMTGADNARDAQLKSSGQALKSATSLSDLALMLGTGGTSTALSKGAGAVMTNALQGMAGGFADELEANGENWNTENAGKRMLVGGLSGAATAGLGNKMNNSTNKLLNNKITNSAIGRGAVSGAVGGAIGGGTMAALNGGDILGTALSTAADGALGGAVSGGVMNMAQKVGNKAINKLWTAEQNHSFQSAINNPSKVTEPVYLGEVSQDTMNNISQAYKNAGIDLDTNPDALGAIRAQDGKLYLTPEGAQHLNQRRIQNGGMSAKEVRQTMRNATQNGTVLPNLSEGGNATMASANEGSKKLDIAHIGLAEDGSLDLRSTYPVSSGKTYREAKNTLDGSLVHHATDTLESDGLAAGASALQGDSSNISQQNKSVNSDLMYGESELANRTKRSMVADGLERFGNSLEGAQTNVTRASTRKLGINSSGEVVENVRKKTGITNMETQAALAKELTGGENSLMDNIQRVALSATEDGSVRRVDTSELLADVDKIVDKYADSNTFSNREQFVKNLKKDINNGSTDTITIANRFKSIAADARGKGIIGASPKDSATAKIYTEVANRLDDLSYSSIPQSNVNDMFDTAIIEMRGRAAQATQNGNSDIAKAYSKLADSLDAEPRTIQAFRSFKKDFVDVSKVSQLSANAENGAAFQMGRGFGGGIKQFTSAALQRPINAGLAVLGGGVNTLAGKLGSDTPNTTANTSTTQSLPLPNQVTNVLGRETGLIEGDDTLNQQKVQEQTSAQQAYLAAQQQAQNAPRFQLEDGRLVTLEDTEVALKRAYEANDMASYNELGQIYQTLQSAQQNGATGTVGNIATLRQQNRAQNIMSQLEQVAELAMQAGDYKALSQVAQLYKTAQSMFETDTKQKEPEKLSATQQRANAAATSLTQLAGLTPDIGYNLSGIPVIGNIATIGGNQYESTAKSLATQIGYMLSGANISTKEAENIGKAYVPQPFDSEEMRQYKLQQAASIIQQYQNGQAD